MQVLGYPALWPRVLGRRPVHIVVVRDPAGELEDTYLFTTDLGAPLAWVVEAFARRWSIEVAFKASKQVLDIEAPQHWCETSIERLAPWVWLMQSMIGVWYLTEGNALPEAESARALLGEWDSEWSLRHMVKVLRRAILNQVINTDSAEEADLGQLIEALKNYVNTAA